MFHKAINLKFKKGTSFELTFQNGEVKLYDVSQLFEKYQQLKALENRELFLQGKLMSPHGIIWNEDLDLEVETVYEDGVTIKKINPALCIVSNAVFSARAKAGLSQAELAALTGIDQADISKIERGLSNPSIQTLNRIAIALNKSLSISFDENN